jgi:hypothetical protein
MPYVVFPGNVGDRETLADIVRELMGRDGFGGETDPGSSI